MDADLQALRRLRERGEISLAEFDAQAARFLRSRGEMVGPYPLARAKDNGWLVTPLFWAWVTHLRDRRRAWPRMHLGSLRERFFDPMLGEDLWIDPEREAQAALEEIDARRAQRRVVSMVAGEQLRPADLLTTYESTDGVAFRCGSPDLPLGVAVSRAAPGEVVDIVVEGAFEVELPSE